MTVDETDQEVHKDGKLIHVHYDYENVPMQFESTRGKILNTMSMRECSRVRCEDVEEEDHC